MNLYPHLPTFDFDGHKFPGMWKTMPKEQAFEFYLAYQAKRGDEAAIAVAVACGLQIFDIDNQLYFDCRDFIA